MGGEHEKILEAGIPELRKGIDKTDLGLYNEGVETQTVATTY